jgi:hypothetical protein
MLLYRYLGPVVFVGHPKKKTGLVRVSLKKLVEGSRFTRNTTGCRGFVDALCHVTKRGTN